MANKMNIVFGEEVTFVTAIYMIATAEFRKRMFAEMRAHVKKQRLGGLSLVALAIHGEQLTFDEQIQLAEQEGRRRLVLKAQVRLCLQNQRTGR
jgi:hypothetical protein